MIMSNHHLIFKISDYLQVVEDTHDLEGDRDAEGGSQQHQAPGHLAARGHQQGEDTRYLLGKAKSLFYGCPH